MAKPRLKPSGKWEIGLRHPSLPGGRQYFTFPGDGVRLSRILGEWSDSGFAAPTQLLMLKTLTREVGSIRFSEANYK
jgi:hypothetical protein